MNGVALAKEKRGFAKPRRNVNVAMTLDQFARLEDAALLKNMNISEYVRYKLFSERS